MRHNILPFPRNSHPIQSAWRTANEARAALQPTLNSMLPRTLPLSGRHLALAAVGLGAIVALAATAQSFLRQRADRHTPRRLPDPISRWEDEGGSLSARPAGKEQYLLPQED